MTLVFAVADIRRVQDYIMETDRLVQMRGGSRILDNLRVAVESATNDCNGRIISDRGGHFVASLDDSASAEQWGARVRDAFVRATGLPGERLVVGTGPKEAEAFREVAEQKRVPVFDEVFAAPLARPCEQCGRRPAARYLAAPGGIQLRSCEVCVKRTDAGRQALTDLWSELDLDQAGHGANLTDFAGQSIPQGYIAVLVADGNSIGEHLQQQMDTADGGTAFRARLTSAVPEAVKAAAQATRGSTGHGLLPLWVGGDDVVLVVHPQNALLAAEVFVGKFAELMADFDVTMSAGLVVAHANHPFVELHALGESLLQETKSAVRAHWYPVRKAAGPDLKAGGVDYEMVKEAAIGPLESRRTEDGGTSRLRPLAVLRPNQTLPDSFTDTTLSAAMATVESLLEMDAPRSSIRSLRGTELPPNLPESVHTALGPAAASDRLETIRELFELRRSSLKVGK